MMEDLLTTTELQELLKLDRTTVYRMLKDGRLRGLKVGQQWRFSRHQVDVLLNQPNPQPRAHSTINLPIHCAQILQDLFADLADVATLTIDLAGNPLTEPSGDQQAAQHLRHIAAAVARIAGRIPQFIDDSSGQQYMITPVLLDGQPQAFLIAGPIEPRTRAVLFAQLARLGRAFESLSTERATMLARLNRIAALSTFAEDVPTTARTP